MSTSDLDRPRIQVDFNELIEHDLVFLSQSDKRLDSNGDTVILTDGLVVYIYEYNKYDDGQEEMFTATGIAELHDKVINKSVKWCCRINSQGISTTYT
jgi:hypothetical protein